MYEPADVNKYSKVRNGNLNSIAEKSISEELIDMSKVQRKNSLENAKDTYFEFEGSGEE